jgi:hypothetical protein
MYSWDQKNDWVLDYLKKLYQLVKLGSDECDEITMNYKMMNGSLNEDVLTTGII